MINKKRMVITDLDGTLFQNGSILHKNEKNTLYRLGEEGIIRVIATGRNLYSAKRVLSDDFPIDYLVFSSGAGIMDWRSKKLLLKANLKTDDINKTVDILLKEKVDFMIHHPIPDNHYFAYFLRSENNSDFLRRIEMYEEYAYAFDADTRLKQASQFLAVIPDVFAINKYNTIKKQLDRLNIIRTTSPLDGKSFWVEIFPVTVSKAIAGQWLANKENIAINDVLSIGNDYNDNDLLEWSGTSFVVANAPDNLRQRFSVVSSNNDNGFTQAVELWKVRR